MRGTHRIQILFVREKKKRKKVFLIPTFFLSFRGETH
jgi:hypothetical protein